MFVQEPKGSAERAGSCGQSGQRLPAGERHDATNAVGESARPEQHEQCALLEQRAAPDGSGRRVRWRGAVGGVGARRQDVRRTGDGFAGPPAPPHSGWSFGIMGHVRVVPLSWEITGSDGSSAAGGSRHASIIRTDLSRSTTLALIDHVAWAGETGWRNRVPPWPLTGDIASAPAQNISASAGPSRYPSARRRTR